VTVERIRAIMLRPRTRIVPAAGAGKRSRRSYETVVGTSEERQRNALIVSMLAYAGLRPVEERGCTWGDLGERTLHVFATKTNRSRDVDLIAPLTQDLAEWRGMRPSAGWRADHSASFARPVDTRGLGELAPTRVASRRDRGGGHRRPAPIPSPRRRCGS
jgi:integrase